jgi:lipopolysaccharide biosynthesis glycosyltransferase
MNNFLYCFDENYNFQAFSSIISLLDNVSEEINLFIIHRIENSIEFLPKEIKLHSNLNAIDVLKFNKDISNFPNLYNAHVSEATYYRLFCTEHLPQDLETIFYIDADIICVKDPTDIIKSNTLNLLEKELTISVKTETLRDHKSEEVFKRLDMDSDRYFNAGVMNLNLNYWRNLDIDFAALFDDFKNKLNYWDQDLLNNIFDGNYLELDGKLNKVINFAYYEYLDQKQDIDKVISDGVFIHFAGSHKPWSVNGIMFNLSEIYQQEFRKISSSNFHITHKKRSLSIYILLKNVYNKNFFKIDNKFIFLVDLFKSLLKIGIKENEA